MKLQDNALAGARVLVVEDQYFLADDMRGSLTRRGAEVIGPLADPDEVLCKIGAMPIDLAVLDIELGGASVFPVASSLRERGIPFVFATGFGPGRVPAEFGQAKVCQKPVDVADLVEGLAGLLRTGRSGAASEGG